ncbi:putative Mak16 protein [Monocercomonoides exilis]|uniref:putative Mak16 protein n=1 Tax=Monocercomonoides exilis TaxID=2049356 RepID=UPI00355AB23E|nr:putative Mak16 protein [Monocercomonoides exilis]
MSLQATDELIWTCIKHGFCSSRAKTITQNFCRNPMNVSGLCKRSSCPLANASYATVVDRKGEIYLMIKTAERMQFPAKLWEKIKLPNNKREAKHIIKDRLQFFSTFMQRSVLRRYRRILQIHGRIRRLRHRIKPHEVGIKVNVERKMRLKEIRAERAADIEETLKKTLLKRLSTYQEEGVFNFPQKAFEKALEEKGAESDEIDEGESDEEEEEEEEEDMSEEEARSKKRGKAVKPRLMYEMEMEDAHAAPMMLSHSAASSASSKSSSVKRKGADDEDDEMYVEDEDEDDDDEDLSDVEESDGYEELSDEDDQDLSGLDSIDDEDDEDEDNDSEERKDHKKAPKLRKSDKNQSTPRKTQKKKLHSGDIEDIV